MKRRANREAAERIQVLRVRIEDVYGGVIPGRARQDETLAQLAASIARHGLLQPIIVRRNSEAGRYALVCGARRLAACRMLGMREIWAACLEMDACTAAACFMEEHLTRRPPGPVEEALAVRGSGELLAGTALDAQAILRRLRLLELPQAVQRIVQERGLSLEQAEPLCAAAGEERQTEAALIIAERSLTPAQARRLVFGPRREAPEGCRRRAVRQALAEVSRLAEKMRAQGVETKLSVHAQEGGMCVQIVFAHAKNGAAGRNSGVKREI